MDLIEFVRAITVEGKAFEAGSQALASEVPADHLDCCLRCGHAIRVSLPVQPPESAAMPESDESESDREESGEEADETKRAGRRKARR